MVKMKIAYVGDFLNHGKTLATTGTTIVFLLSMMDEVESIDVHCPVENERIEPVTLPPKIRVIETYRYDKALSLMKLLRIKRYSYDKVIFNLLPTAFGNSSITNAFGICIPIILAKLLGMHNIEIVYHNSVFTNDIRKLGYTSIYDRFRSGILKIIEGLMFKNIPTFVLLRIYKDRIHSALKNDKVRYLNAESLEAVSTVFLNHMQEKDVIMLERDKKIPTVLLHGSWGPQKNIELGIETMDRIRKDGYSFNLIITGGINHHFPGYEKHFREIMGRYNFTGCYKGPVTEKEIFTLFTTSDLLLLPYNTPGGHSGVLEQSKFFEVPTIAIDFPEYREQAQGKNFVTLCQPDSFYAEVSRTLNNSPFRDRIEIRNKVTAALHNMLVLLGGE
jgi:glycosyltransferase involved in cell wall biosynthesis